MLHLDVLSTRFLQNCVGIILLLFNSQNKDNICQRIYISQMYSAFLSHVESSKIIALQLFWYTFFANAIDCKHMETVEEQTTAI